MRAILVAPLFAIAASTAGAAAQKPDFEWSKSLAAGGIVSVHNINGNVTVLPGSGSQVEVSAVRHGSSRDHDPYVAVKEYSGGVAICVLWRDTEESCDEDGAHMQSHRSRWDDNGRMDVTVHLPSSLRVDARSVSGNVSITGAQGDVRAASVSGDVRLEGLRASGVRAQSVSGNVDVSIVALTGNGDLSFTSVSGDVAIAVPQAFDADFSMSTVSGDLRTDFPLTLNGRMGRRNIEARIGRGGRRVEVSTVSGDVQLRAAK